MKKYFTLLLCLLLLCAASVALAVDAERGDEVTINFSVSNPNQACSFEVKFSYDTGALEFVSASGAAGVTRPGSGSGKFVYYGTEPFGGGSIGSVTFRVKSNAAKGTYPVTANSAGAWDIDGNTVSISASGGSVTVVIPPCATHTWNDGYVLKEATCTEDGQKRYTCTVCGEQKAELEKIPATGHTAGASEDKPAATCTEDGTRVTYCATCTEVMKTETIPATGHTPGESAVTKEPTCTEVGTKVTQCATCGKTMKTVTLDALGHTEVTDAAVAATCEKTGLTEGEHCSVCNEVLKKQETVAVIAHDRKDVKSEGASCTAPGKKMYYCSMCGKLQATEELEVLGHTPVVDAAVAPTCTKTGLTEGSHCSVCKTVIKKQEVVPELGHTVVKDAAVAPTCTKSGLTEGSHCSVCKAVLVKQETVPAAHTPSDDEVRVEPTCTTDGSTSYVCKVCGTKINSQKIPALGHKWDEGVVTTEATCTKKGVKTFTCQNDATHTRTESIKATGVHIWDEGKVTLEPTCTKTGTKTFTCTYEGCTRTKKETLAKLGHDYDEGVVTTAPTCTKNGVKTLTCKNDAKHTKTESIAKLGHNYDEGVVTTAPTCTENGVKTYTCQNDTSHTKTERINKLGHDWEEWIITKPVTEEENGEKQRTCKTCKEVEIKIIRNRADYVMTVCTEGIRFRDLDNPVTDEWYMFTPIDLSVEGEQTFNMIAGNMHIIGTVTVLVQDGMVTITYEVNNPVEIHVYNEFLTLLPSLSDVTEINVEEMTSLVFGEPISIEEELGGDTRVLLFMCNRALYAEDTRGVNTFKKNSEEYELYVEELKLLMD